jgi:hypothetical protein
MCNGDMLRLGLRQRRPVLGLLCLCECPCARAHTRTRRRRDSHAARNAALMMELRRQRHAFALALGDMVETSVAEAGACA